MATSETTEAGVKKALGRGRRNVRRGPLAVAASYAAGRVRVDLSNGCAFEFPFQHAQELAKGKPHQLRSIEIQGSGLSLHWPKLNADLYVPALVKGVFGNQLWMLALAAEGGRSTSEAKRSAARSNGARGGRPRKTPKAEA